ncbi:MAG: SMC-Scp complex subunit ScpB [Lachnospiraceae bacterium]|nr:SMC-Scp complex subunit ScpB [Lachnospiraceae bacterium]
MTVAEETAAEETAVEENVIEENGIEENVTEETVEEKVGEEKAVEEKVTETAEDNGEEAAQKKPRKKRVKKTEEPSEEEEALPKPDCPEAAIEAVLFATGNSVPIEQLADILNMKQDEVRAAIANLKERYESEDRGITITELEDAVQLGTKGEYYEYLMKLAKHPKHYSLSDTVIETLSIIAYKQPVTRGEIEKIRGVSCDHALNKLLEYDLIEEVGRLDAPGKPLLFGTTEQFLRSFGVKSIGELPTVSPEMVEDFKVQAEAEAAEDLALENIKVDV